MRICLSVKFKLTAKLSSMSATNRCFSCAVCARLPIISIMRSNCVIYPLGNRFNMRDLSTYMVASDFFFLDFSAINCFAIVVDSLINSPYGITHETSGPGIGGSSGDAGDEPAPLAVLPVSAFALSCAPNPLTSSNDNCNSIV